MQAYQTFASYLLDGNEKAAYEFLLENHNDSIYLYQDIVTNAMRYIGELWQQNEITVADEHLATSVCEFVLSQFFYLPSMKKKELSQKKIMLYCIEDEQHALGTKMIAGLCREKDWQVRYHGANLPLNAMMESVETWRPQVIGLSAAMTYRLPTLLEYIDKLSTLSWKPKILIGGRIATIIDLKKHVNTECKICHDMNDFSTWLDHWESGVGVNGAG
ncbi:cobalamin B12-binding domain-containing protein [Gracilibacillus massiliensis]|uniref:cobalamin B12-binding domain-containing protein n=1 Tax=Gracilibacillus massiliensis TaxID=1564956 RepID=UPI00071C71E5|nr:cobalamin B12-binding domain-containing protein [Gracilibacillus massiliensis]